MKTNEFSTQFPTNQPPFEEKVRLNFGYPSSGWIQLTVMSTGYLHGIVITFSNIIDDFSHFIKWLGSIVDGNLPNEFLVDEGGSGIVLRATPFDEVEFLFDILERMRLNENEEPVLKLHGRVNKKEFLTEFLIGWDDFLIDKLGPTQREDYTTRLRELDVTKIREFAEKR
jgi:hypothetical protein